MKAVILSGGKGTRLYPITKAIPKPLIKIGNKPLIEHQILLLKKYGVKEIFILSGYFGEKIKDYLKEGKKWGVKIHCFKEDEPLGTAGAIKTLAGKIKEDFLLLSGDIMMDFDVRRFIKWHEQKKSVVLRKKKIGSIIAHPNDHPFDSDLVEVNHQGEIISLLKRPHPQDLVFRNLSIASVFIFSPSIFKYIPSNKKTDIEKDILPKVLKNKEKIYVYNTPEYLKDVGTIERLKETRHDFATGKIKRLNLNNKRKAVFIDRDGVINKEVDQLVRKEDFKIYNFAAQAIKTINNSDYLSIIITNQPMIAKGWLTEDGLNEIHKKMETELGKKGAKIDAIYYCPHHSEKGFLGEVPELKIKCDCRKPCIGLIERAVDDFNIDLRKSFFIGDSSVDAKTAENAKIKFVGVRTGYACKDKKHTINQKITLSKNLLEAVGNII